MNDNMLKEALKRREKGGLPSNFTHVMMQKVQHEAVKQRKRRVLLAWTWLVAAASFFLGMAVYFVFFYLEVDLSLPMPQIEKTEATIPLFLFYLYIGVLVLLLLFLDYWLRSKRRKTVG
ncbi:hypothetical protein D0T50_11235 [Bacteroides sp. 214]|uniref:hypothetical protein n=1 Tax=Bacteroides sp. 214 TaxID=2302935 RepID=UPI0013CFDCDE|nr:hypothetical protein [Bacteroides sp. 214]NDW13462.1 hypothetical protein [Bacteroides sp. 214]